MKNFNKKLIMLGLIVSIISSMLIPCYAVEATTDQASLEAEAIKVQAALASKTYQKSLVTEEKQDQTLSAAAATTYQSSFSYYRGSFLMWSETDYVWQYQNSVKVDWSQVTEDCGYIGLSPISKSTVDNEGKTDYSHKADATYDVVGGILTPFGALGIIGKYSHEHSFLYYDGDAAIDLNGDGTFEWANWWA